MKYRGLTLTELLIALGILGVISAFTVPKVLLGFEYSDKKAKTKEVTSMVAASYLAYQLENSLSSTTTNSDLVPFMNYVSVDTVSIIDDAATLTSIDCSGFGPGCLRLHNGGILYVDWKQYGGTDSTNILWWTFDPDATYSGSTTGEGKALKFVLYYDGTIKTWGQMDWS